MARNEIYDKNTFPLLAEQFAREGKTDIQIAKSLGINKDTYYNYQKKYPEFLDAIKRGKKPVDVEVENQLLKRALGYEYTEEQREIEMVNGEPIIKKIKSIKKHISPDVGAIAFWLKNRRPDLWREKQYVDHTTKGEKILTPVTAGTMTREEMLQYLDGMNDQET